MHFAKRNTKFGGGGKRGRAKIPSPQPSMRESISPDTSETIFIGTSEFSKEMLSFLSISERLEPRVERISFFFSYLPVLNFSMACSTNLKASLANLIRLSIWSPVSAKSSSRRFFSFWASSILPWEFFATDHRLFKLIKICYSK